LLPLVMDANIRALQERDADGPTLRRYDEIAKILTGNPNAQAAEGVTWVRELCTELGVPPLAMFGVTEADIPDVVAKAQQASSMQGNPIKLTAEELGQILREAIGTPTGRSDGQPS
jgi:alcohol dehydrogenase class IV